MDEEIRQLLESLQIEGYGDTAKKDVEPLVEKPVVGRSWARFPLLLVVGALLVFAISVCLFFWVKKEDSRRLVRFYDVPQTAVTMAPFIASTKTAWSTNNLCGGDVDSSERLSSQIDVSLACMARKRVLGVLRADIDHMVESLVRAPDSATQEALSEAIDRLQQVDQQLTKHLVEIVALAMNGPGNDVCQS